MMLMKTADLQSTTFFLSSHSDCFSVLVYVNRYFLDVGNSQFSANLCKAILVCILMVNSAGKGKRPLHTEVFHSRQLKDQML